MDCTDTFTYRGSTVLIFLELPPTKRLYNWSSIGLATTVIEYENQTDFQH